MSILKYLEELSARVGFGKKIIYSPVTGKVRVEDDLLAGYYHKELTSKDASLDNGPTSEFHSGQDS